MFMTMMERQLPTFTCSWTLLWHMLELKGLVQHGQGESVGACQEDEGSADSEVLGIRSVNTFVSYSGWLTIYSTQLVF